MPTPLPAIERVMEVYKYRQVDLAADMGISKNNRYIVSRWVDRGLVPVHLIRKVVRVAKKRDERNRLPDSTELIIAFIRDYERKRRGVANGDQV